MTAQLMERERHKLYAGINPERATEISQEISERYAKDTVIAPVAQWIER